MTGTKLNTAIAMEKLQQKFKTLQQKLGKTPLILQGSLFEFMPPADAPRANPRYLWTRKIDQKSVSISLSKRQYDACARAVDGNRRLMNTLKEMREISEAILSESLPGPTNRTAKAERSVKK